MEAPHRITCLLDSRLEELERLHDTVAAFCQEVGRPDHAAAFNLCAEELVTNAILHGHRGEAGHPILVEVWADAERIDCRIVDDGPAFDPTRDDPVDIDSSLEERGIGGLGRHLVSTMMDRFSYAREDGRNVVSFGRATTR